MSVRAGDRGEGKLEVLNKARELKKYSLHLLKNEKVFPKSSRWLYAYPIANEVRSASICIRQANSVFVSIPEEYTERRLKQTEAHEHIDALYDLLDDAYDIGYISAERCDYWVGLIKAVDDSLKSWMKSDKERYK